MIFSLRTAMAILFYLSCYHCAITQSVEAQSFKTVDFGSAHFSIPDNYIPSITNKKSGSDYAAFEIGILLPNFDPAGTDVSEFRRVGLHRQLTVLVEHGQTFRDAADILNETLRWAHVDPDSPAATINGCKLYTGNFAGSTEIYSCGVGAEYFDVKCFTEKEFPYPGCVVFRMLEDRTTIIYRYSRSYVEQAMSIDKNIFELIRRFERK